MWSEWALLPLLLMGGVLASLLCGAGGLSRLTGWNRMAAAVLGREALRQRARDPRGTHTRRGRSRPTVRALAVGWAGSDPPRNVVPTLLCGERIRSCA